MKARYFADDGKEFSTEEECLAYERDIALDKYLTLPTDKSGGFSGR